MEIAMKIGEDTYIGLNAEMAYTAVSLDKAMIFEHAYDIFDYINKNRKKINAFLRRNKVNMIIKVVKDTEKELDLMDDTELIKEEHHVVPNENVLTDDDFSMAC